MYFVCIPIHSSPVHPYPTCVPLKMIFYDQLSSVYAAVFSWMWDHWSVVNLPGATPLKRADSPSSRSHQLYQLLKTWGGGKGDQLSPYLHLIGTDKPLALKFFCFLFLIVLAILELNMQTRLASNSQRHTSLTLTCNCEDIYILVMAFQVISECTSQPQNYLCSAGD